MDLFFLGRSANGTTLISGETSCQYVLSDFEDTQAIEGMFALVKGMTKATHSPFIVYTSLAECRI